jgi:hypothetical protein
LDGDLEEEVGALALSPFESGRGAVAAVLASELKNCKLAHQIKKINKNR